MGRPGYPTRWEPLHKRDDEGFYKGVVTRLLSPTSDQTLSCSHEHATINQAKSCSVTYAALKNTELPDDAKSDQS